MGRRPQTDKHPPPSPFTGKFSKKSQHLGLESISYLVHALTLAYPVSEMPELEAVAGYSLVLLLLVLLLLVLVSPRGARLQKAVQRCERLCPRQSLEKRENISGHNLILLLHLNGVAAF